TATRRRPAPRAPPARRRTRLPAAAPRRTACRRRATRPRVARRPRTAREPPTPRSGRSDRHTGRRIGRWKTRPRDGQPSIERGPDPEQIRLRPTRSESAPRCRDVRKDLLRKDLEHLEVIEELVVQHDPLDAGGRI